MGPFIIVLQTSTSLFNELETVSSKDSISKSFIGLKWRAY